MKSRLLAIATALLVALSCLVATSPAEALTEITQASYDCPSSQLCPQVTFNYSPNTEWGDTITVSVNSSVWCTSELAADDISGLQMKQVFDSLGMKDPVFEDTSTRGGFGSHTGKITFPHGATTYWVAFATVCGFSGPAGAVLIEAWSRTYQIDINPNPLDPPQNIKVTPHDTSFLVSWDPVPNAGKYVVSLNGVNACDGTATSCLVSGQQTGALITSLKISAINIEAPVPFFSGVANVPPFRVAEPIAITGSVSGAMKVGSTLTFKPVTLGTITNTEWFWYACDAAISSQRSQPNCMPLMGNNTNSFTLTAAQLGKYVVPFIHANSAWSDAMYSPGSAMAVVAADAVAPTPPADPSGKPTVSEISNREVPVIGGTTVVLSGTNLGGVTEVTINGVAANIVAKTDTSVTILVPASPDKSGLADIVVKNEMGTSLSSSAIIYVKTPVIIHAPKILKVSGFSNWGYSLSTAQKTLIKKLVTSAGDYSKLSCIGDSTGLKVSAAQKTLATRRASAACAYAKTLAPKILTKATGTQSKTTGFVSRFVKLTFTN
jgi:hypothetical protein